MRRQLFFLVMLVCTIGLKAWEPVSAHSKLLDVHLRVAAREGARFGIRLAQGDTTCWTTFSIAIPNVGADELDGRIFPKLSIGHNDGSRDVVDSTFTVSVFASDGRVPEMSLKVTHYDGRGAVVIGEKFAVFTKPFPVDNDKPLYVDFFSDRKTNILRNTIRADIYPELEYSLFSSVEEARAYAESSTDPLERVWNYYDSTTMPIDVSVGRGYKLVSVRTDGGYDLVLIDLENRQARVQPLMIKGRLTPTDFIDVFNLDWRDSLGRPVCRDASVKFEGNMMILFFPAWDVSIRFTSATK